MSRKKDFLGRGRYGLVHGTGKYAIKQIDDKTVFDVEAEAYCSPSKVESLRGRIPKFYSIEHEKQLLYLKRIDEPTLRQAVPDETTLPQIKEYVSETIRIIHESGWCHGDINLDNIFASGLLFDFSHAHTKSKLCAQAWKYFQKKDREDIRRCYLQAVGLKKLEAAIVLLDSGVDGLPRQAELAELPHNLETSLELLKKLEEITDLTPSLALETCRAFRQEGRIRTGMGLLQKSTLPIPCDDESRRLNVQIQGETALCESHFDDGKACELFAGAVRSSIDLLGPTELVTSMRELVMQMEERLREKRVKKRRRERPMPVEYSLVKDDKENMDQSEPHSPSKKRKLTQEAGTKKQGERGEKAQEIS